MKTGSGGILAAQAKRIDTGTGEIHEGIDVITADKMRACDADITSLDTEIERVKDPCVRRGATPRPGPRRAGPAVRWRRGQRVIMFALGVVVGFFSCMFGSA
jgi:hypothetical protein